MTRALFGLALAIVFGLGAASPSYAQEKSEGAAKQEEKKDTSAEDAKKKEEEDKKKNSDYEKEIKDLVKHEGAFNLYQKGKQILLELPEDKIGKIFFIQAAWNTGAGAGLQAGDPTAFQAVDAFRWDKKEDSIWLVRPNTKFRWSKEDPLSLASQRSFPEAILGSFKISKSHPGKKLMLLDVTNFFYGDLFRLTEAVNMGLMGQYMPDREKSGPEKIKSFPENSTVQMSLHYYSPRGGGDVNPLLIALGLASANSLEDGRSAPLKVTYNMWYPKEGYAARLSDPRIGYFTQDYFTVDKFLNEDRTERLINRWNLQKKNPEAPMSEPVKPIVFTLDNSIPEQYRESVRQAVLMWNKAFEPLGYKNAVQVQDQPKDPDWDHADGRYNVIRWTMSTDAGYAVSLFRTDPFTGEILNASITFDANMLAYSISEHQAVSTPAASAHKRALDVLTRDPNRKETDDFYLFASDKERAEHKLDEMFAKAGWAHSSCRNAFEKAHSASFAFIAARAAAGGMKVSKETYAKQFITDVISHEVGHCLGLRHNFVASTAHDLNQLNDDSFIEKNGITASVMDYTPVNVMAMLKGSGRFFTPSIGTYDVWAIKYGYTDVKASSPLGEKPVLSGIANLSVKPGYAFMTDEEANDWNPYVATFDNGKDPVAHASKMLTATNRVKNYAITQLPKANESFSKRTNLVMSSIDQVFKQGRLVARFVGGVDSNRNFKNGHANQKTLAPVDPKSQREALHLITKSCLSTDSFALPKDVLMTLTVDSNMEDSASWNAPLRDYISMNQQMIYSMLMSASTTDRIAENQFKWGKSAGAYTMDNHFATILGAVFSEVGQNKSIEPLRRDLQRFAVNVLTVQAGAGQGGVNEDVRMLASDSLRRLSTRFGSQLANTKGLDAMTKIHLRDTKESIDRFLKRAYK